MPSGPTVSAIITAYNSEKFIAQALDSVLGQSRKVDQIIVVDDGSDDETAAIAEAFQGVEVIRQDNAGPGSARNTGLRAATGDLIAYLDADDAWLPEKTRLQLDYLAMHPNAIAVSGGKIWRTEAGERVRSHDYSVRQRSDLRRTLPLVNCVGNPSMVLMRKSAIATIGGFNEDIIWGQDWDLWIRLLQQGDIGFLPEDVIEYTWHAGNHSHRRPEARLRSYLNVSRIGIARLAPVWLWPFMHLKALGEYKLRLAAIARGRGDRVRAGLLAVQALGLWPFRDGAEKLKLLLRAILGEWVYAIVKRAGARPTK